MPQYGEKEYWDTRYLEDETPFDWLFDYEEVAPIIEYLLPDKEELILLVGAGNAPFSPHLTTKGGYTQVWNTDLSPVVIEKQTALFPDQRWQVMDVMDMPIQDEMLPAVIDKSLIDTLLCCNGSAEKLKKMMNEIHRVMASGARFISFSLHPVHEVVETYTQAGLDWSVSFYHVRSNRWNPGRNRKRSLTHTMIICDKPFGIGDTAGPRVPRSNDLSIDNKFPGLVLTDQEDAALKASIRPILLRKALKLSTTDTVLFCLYHNLCDYAEAKTDEFISEEDKKGITMMEKSFSRWKKQQARLKRQAAEAGIAAEQGEEWQEGTFHDIHSDNVVGIDVNTMSDAAIEQQEQSEIKELKRSLHRMETRMAARMDPTRWTKTEVDKKTASENVSGTATTIATEGTGNSSNSSTANANTSKKAVVLKKKKKMSFPPVGSRSSSTSSSFTHTPGPLIDHQSLINEID